MKQGEILKFFDPWGKGLCTCLPKYSLNPYTGCMHRCQYCYITSYIPSAFKIRTKKEFFKRLLRDIERIENFKYPVSISNSSDPYPAIEKKLNITRNTLEILKEIKNVRVSIITKSPLVKRDIDILRRIKATVSLTITSIEDELAKKLEPFAPLPSERIKILPYIYNSGIPLCVRIDPLIPGINTDKKKIEKLIKSISPYIKMISLSTYKAKPDNFNRMKKIFPFIAREHSAIENLPFKKEKIRGYKYIDDEIRIKILTECFFVIKNVNPLIKLGICREFPEDSEFNFLRETKSCDPIFENFV